MTPGEIAMVAVQRERERQDAMWGSIDDRADQIDMSDWFLILNEEVGELAAELTHALVHPAAVEDWSHEQVERWRSRVYGEATQIAAVAVAFLEWLELKHEQRGREARP